MGLPFRSKGISEHLVSLATGDTVIEWSGIKDHNQFKKIVKACIRHRPFLRQTAKAMLEHPFFTTPEDAVAVDIEADAPEISLDKQLGSADSSSDLETEASEDGNPLSPIYEEIRKHYEQPTLPQLEDASESRPESKHVSKTSKTRSPEQTLHFDS